MIMNIEEIKTVLPHREPFLFVDQVDELVPGKSIVARKAVGGNEWYFLGHFAETKVMPGVLIIEAMAQAGCIALMKDPAMKSCLAYLAKIKNARFHDKVHPGDTLILKAELGDFKLNVGFGECEAYVGEKLVADCTLAFAFEEGKAL